MKEMPDLICGKTAAGGNYNSTHDNTAEVENIMIDDKELFMKTVEHNPKVINQKTYINEETGQEITYIKVKK